MSPLRPALHLHSQGFVRLALLMVVLSVLLAFPAAAQAPSADSLPILDNEIQVTTAPTSPAERVQVLVELSDPPAAAVYGAVLHDKSRTAVDAKVAAIAAGRAQVALIAPKQARLSSQLAQFHATEIYRVSKAMNGIAVQVEAGKVAALRKLPGVKAVYVIEQEYPTNAISMPFLGVPQLWSNTLGLGQSLTGTGIRIGIIDTGIDYQHANFGGTGAQAAYTANDRVTIGPGLFPTAKVIGGTDFAGDAYTGGNTPVPDPNPMDCNGHGSHVSGTAAGFGVTSTGATYTGPFDGTAPFSTLRIGPGAAPQASLYALRVFGCAGSTGLTVQAIDWSVDPNNDDDLSDHLDVINMSLGSTFGTLTNTSTIASENAAAAGVIVVAAAGNAGDTYFISGAPGVSSRTISVAATNDTRVAGAYLQVNSPAGIAGRYSAAPDVFGNGAPPPSGQTAAVVLALDAANASGPLTTDGCTALTNAAAIAGNIALVDRGTCGFQVKAATAQAAGAIGVIVANNVAGDPTLVNMGATAGQPNITIPAVFISLADANAIKANLGGGVNATLGASDASDTLASFSSHGPRDSSASMRLKPDIAAPGVNIVSTQSGITCPTGGGCITPSATGYIPDNQSLTISGTSMATPHMTGIMALLRQLHPDWSVEELKAVVMDTALTNVTFGAGGSGPRYALSRVGASRVAPPLAAQAQVLAYNSEDVGQVSITFDSREVIGTSTQVKKLRLVNHGTTDVTYDLAFDTVTDSPGVAFSLPGGSTVTVPGSGTLEINVQMDATADQMNHVKDPTVAPVQAAPAPLTSLGNLARHYMTEEGAYLNFRVAGTLKLRVPIYSPARATSAMASASTIVTGGAPTGSTTLALSGTDVCTGTRGAGPTCTGTFPVTEVSLVTPLELQVVSPLDPVNAPGFADIQYAGVAFNPTAGVLEFGISTWASWASLTDVAFNVYIDNNNDGVYDRILFNSNPGTMASALFGTAGAVGQDSFITGVFNLATNGVATQQFLNGASAASVDSRVIDNNVIVLAATPASLGITGPFRYKIVTCPGFAPLCAVTSGFNYDTAAGPYAWGSAAQGLNFGAANLSFDLNGGSLPVTWNTANMTTNGSLGALLLHHHNAHGHRAQVVPLDTAQVADLAIVASASPANPTFGQSVVFTVTATNGGPAAATGVVVSIPLPDGLTYVSDDGGGAYDPNTGLWTLPAALSLSAGPVANALTATLHVTATLDTTDPVSVTVQRTASTPLDTNSANDRSVVTLLAPRSADVVLTASVSSPTVLPGGSVTYTLTAKNNGTDPAYAIDINEAFPAFPSLVPTGFTVSQGTFNSATGVWNFATLASGSSATLTFTVTAPNIAGPLTNNGVAAATTSDPNNANNSASATTNVVSAATVSGTKAVAGTFNEGATVTYTVVLSNSGPNDQQDNPGDEFTDVLPAGLTLVDASATSGTATADVAGHTVHWSGAITNGGSVTITIHATINSGTFGQTISNQGTIHYDADGNGTNEATATTDDPNTAAAGDTTSFAVASPATVSGTKSVSGNFQVGGSVTYTVTLHNTGAQAQQDNPGDEFVDVLPAALQLTSATASSGTPTADLGTGTVHWNGTIAAGGTVTITIQATIRDGFDGSPISNQGTINFDADGNGTNESSVMTDDPSTGAAGDPTVFQAASIAQVPTLSGLGLALLGVLLLGAAFFLLRRRTA